MFKTFTICLFLSFSVWTNAQSSALKSDYPTVYTTQSGDNVWSIASQFLDNPMEWPRLYYAHPGIHNPAKLHPGDTVHLKFLDGKPYIQVLPSNTIKLSPRIRVQPLNNAIPTIPFSILKPFLNNTRVVQQGELEKAPFIVAQAGEHVISGAGDTVYVEGIQQYESSHLSDFAILRKGHAYVDPQTKQVLGYEALDVGTAHLVNVGSPSTMLITSTRLEVMRGDRIMPLFEDYNVNFQPRIPTEPIEGQIIGVMGGVTQIGQYQIVVFNRGSYDHVSVGDLFAVFQQSQTVQAHDSTDRQGGLKLPGQRAGDMMLFRVFDRVSYGLILQASMPIHLLDTVKTPVD